MATARNLLGSAFSMTTLLWLPEAWINSRIREGIDSSTSTNMHLGALFWSAVIIILATVLGTFYFKAIVPVLLAGVALYLIIGWLYSVFLS